MDKIGPKLRPNCKPKIGPKSDLSHFLSLTQPKPKTQFNFDFKFARLVVFGGRAYGAAGAAFRLAGFAHHPPPVWCQFPQSSFSTKADSSQAALVGGFLSGPIEAYLLQPTDVVKTKLQMSPTSNGIIRTGRCALRPAASACHAHAC